MVALPDWADVAMPAVAAAFAERKILAQGYVLPAYAAVEVAHAAIADATGGPVADLSGRDFATAIGTVSFDDKGDLTENPYRVFRFDGDEIQSRDGALMFSTGPRNLITDVAGLRVGNASDDTAEVRRHRPRLRRRRQSPASRCWAARRARARPICSSRTIRSRRSTRSCCRAAQPSGSTPRPACRRRCAKRASASTCAATACRSCRPRSSSTWRNGGDKDWGRYPPYRELGYEAAQNASQDFAIGTVGAGTGALTAGLKGGLGSASTVLDSGVTCRRAGGRQLDWLGHGRPRQAFLGGALRDRRRIRQSRLSLADPCRGKADPAEIPRQVASAPTRPSPSSPPTR